MPLDPSAAEMLTFISMAFPDLGGTVHDAAEARALLGRIGFLPGPEMARVEDRRIPGPMGAPDLPVRIYWPAADEGPLPLVVYFHGGGFVLCDLDTHDSVCRRAAAGAGAIVVSVGYRLAPEHPFPAAVDDAYAAACWASVHAPALAADPDRLAVAGDSAGGNLAAVTCLSARDAGGPAIAFQLLICPSLDYVGDYRSRRTNAEGYFLTETHIRWYAEQYLGELAKSEDWRASPIHADSLAGLPEALVVTAECDPLRDEGEAYAQRLSAEGSPAAVQRAAGLFHGFFGLGDFIPSALTAEDRAIAALRIALTR